MKTGQIVRRGRKRRERPLEFEKSHYSGMGWDVTVALGRWGVQSLFNPGLRLQEGGKNTAVGLASSKILLEG